MNNNIQLSEQKSYFKSLIKPLLLVILGIILGAGIISIFWLFLPEREEGISQETQAEIVRNFKKDVAKNYSGIFGVDSVMNIYIKEEEEDKIGVLARADLSDEQIQIIFEVDPKELSPEELEQVKGLQIFVKAEYIKKGESWILEEKPRIYQAVDLQLVQESLGSTRDKARDVGIKANLSGMRSAAELWAMDHNDSYDGFCKGTDAQRAIAEIAKNGKTALCDDTATTWAAFSPLYDTITQCYCVDYWGTAEALNSPCPKTAITVCP